MNIKKSSETKIDSISNLNELQAFLKLADSTLKNFQCIVPHDYSTAQIAKSPLKKTLDSLVPRKEVLKADLDANGFTDIIVTGKSHFSFHAFAILSLGDNNYKTLPLTMNRNYTEFPVYANLVYQGEIPTIEIYQKKSNFNEKEYIKTTLVYKDGGFIEFQDNVSDYKITKIEFGTTGCFGTCPVFDMTIRPEGKSLFDAKYYNFSQQRGENSEEEGKFQTIIKSSDFNAIVQIMNTINIKELESNYLVDWTDDQTSKLTVHFADGTSKYIQDYGMQGTRGLKVLYEKLLALRFNQDWQKI